MGAWGYYDDETGDIMFKIKDKALPKKMVKSDPKTQSEWFKENPEKLYGALRDYLKTRKPKVPNPDNWTDNCSV
jgi:hypothetical protein